jgi:molecular chaperone DnaK
MEYGLGVDLGTTYTAAAVNVDGELETVRLGGRRPEIPSLVFLRADGGPANSSAGWATRCRCCSATRR